MIAFLTLLYVGLLVLLVKLKIIKWTPFWKISPALWFALLIVVLFIPMQWGAPGGPVRAYAPVIEIIPNVSGMVKEIMVKPLQPLKKGDPLFSLDPQPFQDVVDQKRAALEEGRQNVPQLASSYEAAKSAVSEAASNRDKAKDEYTRYSTANERAKKAGKQSVPFSESDVEQRRLTLAASEATLKRSLANEENARLSYTAEFNGVNTTVARLEAELRRAEYDLRETVIRAPADGYVAGLMLFAGQRVTNIPLRSWVAFIPQFRQTLAMAVPQTLLRHVKIGDKAEAVFKIAPGKTFEATVNRIVQFNSAGQLPPSGLLPSLMTLYGTGEPMAVILTLDDGSLPENLRLPGGADGSAAIYTSSVKATHLIRKVMLRMDSWMNFILPG
jgi:multidrug resistance efflux pump